MSIHIKEKNGYKYAYEVISKWNKETKKRYKQTRYLGVVTNSETKGYKKVRGEKVPKEKFILDYGDTYILNESLKNSDIYEDISKVLPQRQDTLKSLMFYKILEGSAFLHAETWYEGNIASIFFPNAEISSQKISEFFRELGNENIQKVFFKRYIERISPNVSNVALDSTGLPNEINIPLTEYGYHGGGVELETRLVMVIDQITKKPLYFRLVAGNICDVSTLVTTSSELKKYGLTTEFMLLDAGYYSDKNIRALRKEKIDFLTRLPSGRKLFKELIRKTENTLEKAKNAVSYNKRSLYIQEIETESCGYKCFAYVCEDIKERGKKLANFIKNSKEDKLSDESINENSKSVGKFVLISNKKLGTDEVLPLYYTRQCAEQAFGIVKSQLDILPLRTHNEQTLKGYTFLCFLSLILSIEIQQKLGGLSSFKDAIQRAKNLHCKVFNNGVVVSECGRQLIDVMERLSVGVPTQSGI
jgi:transposase